jgi:NMD protein affecting ribosome stability and mRNA decay
MRFCPKCGKEIQSGVFCSDCQDNSLIDLSSFKMGNILVCQDCSRIYFRNKWKKSDNLKQDIENIIKKEIKQLDNYSSSIKLKVELPENIITKLEHAKTKNDFDAKVICDKNGITEEHIISVHMVLERCKGCSKRDSTYFEGILQIRNPDDDLLSFLDSEFQKAEKERIFVTAYKKHKKGFDYYMTSKRFISKLVNTLKEKYGGSVKLSEKLFSYDPQKGKDIFRLNAIYVKPLVSKGNIIVVNKSPCEVVSLGKDAFAKNLETGQKIRLDFEKEYEILKSQKTSVVKIYPNFEALDPITYQSLDLITDDKSLKLNQKIKVVSYNEKLYHIK